MNNIKVIAQENFDQAANYFRDHNLCVPFEFVFIAAKYDLRYGNVIKIKIKKINESVFEWIRK